MAQTRTTRRLFELRALGYTVAATLLISLLRLAFTSIPRVVVSFPLIAYLLVRLITVFMRSYSKQQGARIALLPFYALAILLSFLDVGTQGFAILLLLGIDFTLLYRSSNP
ncbi:MAG: hypothetical protein CSA97_01930 [Bacteroidetes bacterium]|nr:MAG: hypothetical protein CSA97_01930 [Bacteroidota bacterium]